MCIYIIVTFHRIYFRDIVQGYDINTNQISTKKSHINLLKVIHSHPESNRFDKSTSCFKNKC